MKFTLTYHDEDRQDLILEAYKVTVTIAFKDAEVWFIDFDDRGIELSPSDDILWGIFVSIGSFPVAAMFSLEQVKLEAINQYDGLMDETLREIASEASMSRELSSPQATGRI